MVKCPQGHEPINPTKTKTGYCAAFDLAHCSDCPNQSICSVKPGKKAFYLRFSDKQRRIALRCSAVDTVESKDRYRWRAGVEATMSEFDRRTGVKRLRVRGFKSVRYCATLKALGLNILRAAMVMAAMLAGIPEKTSHKGSNDTGDNVFRERFWAAICFFARLRGCRINYTSIWPI